MELTTLEWVLGSVTAIVALGVGAWRLYVVRSRAAAILKKKEDEMEAQLLKLAEAVEARTHLADGRVRCKLTVTCNEAATHYKPKIVRDNGVVDFFHRLVGAPHRLRVSEDLDGELYGCESHIHLARQDYQLKVAEIERARVERVRDEEVELGHYERIGAGQRIARLIAEHEEKENPNRRNRKTSMAPAQVVPIRGTGTNGST
jgi:hypothetical protein